MLLNNSKFSAAEYMQTLLFDNDFDFGNILGEP